MSRLIRKYWLVLLPLAAIVAVSVIYIAHFGSSVLDHTGAGEGKHNAYEAFGQFGDYFGGLLNPLLAFMSLALLIYYQQNSVAKTGERDVIFRMMQVQRGIVDSFELKSKEMTAQGLRAFWTFDDEIKNLYKESGLRREDTSGQKLAALIAAYERFYHQLFRKQYLGHYFRHLYHIYKLIDSSETFSEKEKLQYAKIVRAQLSHLELKLLFLNCCSSDGKPFQKYVGKFDLLEWFDDEEFDNYDTEFRESSIIKNTIQSWRQLQ